VRNNSFRLQLQCQAEVRSTISIGTSRQTLKISSLLFVAQGSFCQGLCRTVNLRRSSCSSDIYLDSKGCRLSRLRCMVMQFANGHPHGVGPELVTGFCKSSCQTKLLSYNFGFCFVRVFYLSLYVIRHCIHRQTDAVYFLCAKSNRCWQKFCRLHSAHA
jgi:hypothetical protein